ncbi:unnamed protein product [Dibothriocephalus latus]|uniref:Uncharacterized protein n=1 Tax=Dibothriocephalus latus TaxID=60516 RepID=A0A3P6PD83_DIBLA|nr:unnamed protein product [Dibothriocephalus latus]
MFPAYNFIIIQEETFQVEKMSDGPGLYAICRNVCSDVLRREATTVGGEGMVVQVDETMIPDPSKTTGEVKVLVAVGGG